MFGNGRKSLLTRLGARLGLLALALQLVLSFAHIHPLPSQIAAISAPAGNSAPDLPAAGDDCAICASIATFATLDVPKLAALIPCGSAVEILAPVSAAGEHRAPPLLYFSSRAPPAI
jgi:hypothetical protein